MDNNSYGRNWANIVLLCLCILFFLILYAKIAVPNPLWGQLQIIVEGALVGGLADWFAVTALFKKPLGFPFHTELLPRKRQSFINATLKLIEDEFLSKRKIYNLIEKLDFHMVLVQLSEKENFSNKLNDKVFEFLLKKSLEIDPYQLGDKVIEYLSFKVKDNSISTFLNNLVNNLFSNDTREKILDNILIYLSAYMARENMEKEIADNIKNYVENKQNGMTLAIAYATNAFNPEELGSLITGYVRELLAYCSEKDGYMYGQLLNLVEDLQNELKKAYYSKVEIKDTDVLIVGEENLKEGNRSFIVLDNKIDMETAVELLIKHPITKGFLVLFLLKVQKHIKEGYAGYKDDKNKAFCQYDVLKLIYELIGKLLEKAIKSIKDNPILEEKIISLFKDFLHRMALSGEKWVLNLAKEVLSYLGKEELNNLVYPKVRKDLIWIRLNGSIVGGILAFIFVIGRKIIMGE